MSWKFVSENMLETAFKSWWEGDFVGTPKEIRMKRTKTQFRANSLHLLVVCKLSHLASGIC